MTDIMIVFSATVAHLCNQCLDFLAGGSQGDSEDKDPDDEDPTVFVVWVLVDDIQ